MVSPGEWRARAAARIEHYALTLVHSSPRQTDLFVSEAANALWKYASAGELSAEEAAEALDRVLQLVDRLLPVGPLAQEALHEAALHRHPVYDLCYAIAARREGCSVLTIDTRLVRLLEKMKIRVGKL